MGNSELYIQSEVKLKNILNDLEQFKHLCIYSAGNRAKELLQMCHNGYLKLSKPEYYLVSEMQGTREYNRNPETLAGIPVLVLGDKEVREELSDETAVFVVSLEHYHEDIRNRIQSTSYKNVYYLTDFMEHVLIADYMKYIFSMYGLEFNVTDMREEDIYCNGYGVPSNIMTYMVQCDSDVGLDEVRKDRKWTMPLQSGAALSKYKITDVTDADGENISKKNTYYNEMTGLYWVWKNTKWDYSGICHYRRQFESDIVLQYLVEDKADVILPMPTSVYPNLRGYYCNWGEDIYYDTMLEVIHDLEPDYYETAKWCAEHEIFIPNNICMAKREILNDYCRFAFKIIDETEKRMEEYQGKKQKRCWESEHVSTIYFMKHNHDYRIVYSNLKRYW